jgi:hypothetical protein
MSAHDPSLPLEFSEPSTGLRVAERPTLAQLRELLGQTSPDAAPQASFPFSLLPRSGFPRGALSEIHGAPGSGKSELILRFLAENPTLRVAWVEDEFTVYPCAFTQAGISLERLLFSQAGNQVVWGTLQILASRLFSVVIVKAKIESEIDLRRLQLAAERSQCAVILISDEPRRRFHWPFQVQLQTQRDADRHEVLLQTLKLPGSAEGNPLPKIPSHADSLPALSRNTPQDHGTGGSVLPFHPSPRRPRK